MSFYVAVSSAFSFFSSSGPRLYRRYVLYGVAINKQPEVLLAATTAKHATYTWSHCRISYIVSVFLGPKRRPPSYPMAIRQSFLFQRFFFNSPPFGLATFVEASEKWHSWSINLMKKLKVLHDFFKFPLGTVPIVNFYPAPVTELEHFSLQFAIRAPH